MAQGYSIVAYTDHTIMVPHPELAEENFLPLTSFEINISPSEPGPFNVKKTCHLCFIALEPDNVIHPYWHRSKYLNGNTPKYAHLVQFDESKPDYEREYTPEGINDMIRIGREKGFFVTYNHPTWSMESYPEYSRYEGMNAMEICNYGCVAAGYEDYNPRVYDDMLRCGKRIYAIAADDNHNHSKAGTRHYDSFGGFTMIKADRLDYRTVTKALEDGHFYASQGPLIHELWFEDGKIHVKCSPADRILCVSGIRRGRVVYAENGEALTEAEFDIFPDDGYVRITVIDEKGYPANTNAYFTDELFE